MHDASVLQERPTFKHAEVVCANWVKFDMTDAKAFGEELDAAGWVIAQVVQVSEGTAEVVITPSSPTEMDLGSLYGMLDSFVDEISNGEPTVGELTMDPENPTGDSVYGPDHDQWEEKEEES